MMSNFVAVLRWITILFELLVFLLFDCFFFYCLWLLPFVLPCQSLISHTHTHIHKPFNNTIHVWTNTLTNKCRHFSVSVSQIIIIIKLNLFFLSRVCWTFFVLLYFMCFFVCLNIFAAVALLIFPFLFFWGFLTGSNC